MGIDRLFLFNFEGVLANRALILKRGQWDTHRCLAKQIKVIGLLTVSAANTYHDMSLHEDVFFEEVIDSYF